MRYESNNDEVKMGCGKGPESIESLPGMMKTTCAIASDALSITRRINDHLFGIGNHCCEKEANPKCFRDELAKTKCELLATVEELAKICTMLGI